MYSIEWNKDFENIDLYADIGKITAQEILDKFGRPDVIWASLDCTTFSIAAISHHIHEIINKDTEYIAVRALPVRLQRMAVDLVHVLDCI